MAKFGKVSLDRLQTCHPDLQLILNEAIKYVDFTITEGFRTKELQDLYYSQGKSEVKFPKGKHNSNPSLAVDIVPFYNKKMDYDDINRFHNVVYFIKGIAFAKGIEVTLGCDWNNNFDTKDHKLHDAPHIELTAKLINNKWVNY